MKKYILKMKNLFFLLLPLSLVCQIKINDDKCFRISTERDSLVYGYHNYFTLFNNSNKKYILNISGFMGKSIVYEDGKRILPFKPEILSNEFDWDDEGCKKNILVIPINKKLRTILHINIIRGYYKFDKYKMYEIDFESTHTLKSPYYYGCKKYVDSLVNKGYKIYEGTLKGKVKLIPKDRN